MIDSQALFSSQKPSEIAILAYISSLYQILSTKSPDKKSSSSEEKESARSDSQQKMSVYISSAKQVVTWLESRIAETKSTSITSLEMLKERRDELKLYFEKEKQGKEKWMKQITSSFYDIPEGLKECEEHLHPDAILSKWNELSMKEINKMDWFIGEIGKIEKTNEDGNFETTYARLKDWIKEKREFISGAFLVSSLSEAKEKLQVAEEFRKKYENAKQELIQLATITKNREEELKKIQNEFEELQAIFYSRFDELKAKINEIMEKETPPASSTKISFASLANDFDSVIHKFQPGKEGEIDEKWKALKTKWTQLDSNQKNQEKEKMDQMLQLYTTFSEQRKIYEQEKNKKNIAPEAAPNMISQLESWLNSIKSNEENIENLDDDLVEEKRSHLEKIKQIYDETGEGADLYLSLLKKWEEVMILLDDQKSSTDSKYEINPSSDTLTDTDQYTPSDTSEGRPRYTILILGTTREMRGTSDALTFKIKVTSPNTNESWQIRRQFKDLQQLHTYLKGRYASLLPPVFPRPPNIHNPKSMEKSYKGIKTWLELLLCEEVLVADEQVQSFLQQDRSRESSSGKEQSVLEHKGILYRLRKGHWKVGL